MTILDLAATCAATFSGEDLLAACQSLGLRRPLGLPGSEAAGAPASRHAPRSLGAVPVSDATAAALAALAAPEGIAVAERVTSGRRCITYVAVRGPWAAVHRIDGDHHVVESLDAEHATRALVMATGLDRRDLHAPPVHSASPKVDKVGASTTLHAPVEVVDVTRAAFDRMTELAAHDDLSRAAAALEGDGADQADAAAIVDAARREAVHVIGLRSLGLRYEGCELSWIGDRHRWLVPLPERAAASGTARPFAGPRHLRVQIEPIAAEWLETELATLFN